MECLCDVRRPEECVVYTLGLRRHVSDEGVVAGGISITGGDLALWCRQVSVSPPRGYKCSEVSILFPQSYRVVTIPRVENCLLGSAWDGSGLMEGGRTVVRLSRGMLVQELEVYGPLVHITIRWHQVTGVPRGTFSSTPRRTSLSSPLFTSSCQWIGIRIRVWQGFGVAVGSMLRARGGPDIIGKVWCSHILKALVEYVSCRYFSNFSRFSSVAAVEVVLCLGNGTVWLWLV